MSNTKQGTKEFGKLREFFWPIHSHEIKKFLPMGLMMFFILFNYTVLRNTKDSLVIPEFKGSGIIPYLKGYVVLPIAILFVIAYTKLLNVFGREKVFYIIVSTFAVLFGSFSFLIYPNLSMFHPDAATVSAAKDAVDAVTLFTIPLGKFLSAFVSIWGMWTYSLFYVMAELWGSAMIALLFWQFANQITRTPEAKRFYAMFGLIANLSLVAAGLSVRYFSSVRESLPAGVDPWGYTLDHLMTAVVVSAFIIMAIYRWMHTSVLTDKRFYDEAEASDKPKKKKVKLSVGESFKLLLHSRYLGYIAVLVLAYGVSMSLIELVWKNQLQAQFPNPNDYNSFMGSFSIATGIVTMLLILFFKGIVAKFGWFRGAIITPLITVITGGLFFGFVLFQEYMTPLMTMTALSALTLSVWIGCAQNVLSKGVKYSLFDPTKEMAYIPLDEELKTKGKAAVDVVGGRLGKAGGGYVASIVLPFFDKDVLAAAPIFFIIVAIVVGAWVLTVGTLSRAYKAKLEEKEPATQPA